MPIYVAAEQSGLDGYWINDVLKGLKSEADKKNLEIQNFLLPETVINTEQPIVLVIGYTRQWFLETCRYIKSVGGTAVAVNLSQDANIDLADATVGFDYYGATEKLISYLYALKKRKIAFLGCKGRLSLESKQNAFLRAAKQKGISYEVMNFSGISEQSSSFSKICENFDAVICSRNAEANHLINYLKRYKPHIADNLYVVSYGGDELSRRTGTSLTCAELNFKKLGEAAVKLHRFLYKNDTIGTVHISVPCRIIIGDSTANREVTPKNVKESARASTYRTDNDYLMYLRAEELTRLWDQLDRQIVAELCRGKAMSHIAEEMFISQSSVKYRVKKMLDSANISDRKELVKIVQKFGLL